MSWNPSHYLKYGDERTRAAVDLLARVRLAAPVKITDLGCGPGNSTQLLSARWPDARVIGVDNSTEMIAAARQAFPAQRWQLADIASWQPELPQDLIFSNAAIQWLPEHQVLMPRLFSQVVPGGALAIQIPSSTYALSRTLIHEISREDRWCDCLEGPRKALTMMPPEFYYDILAPQASFIDIWESEYHHVMPSKSALVDWIASTGLRPFLNALADSDQCDAFLDELRQRVDSVYESRIDGNVLFPFRRTFIIAYRASLTERRR